MDISSFAACPLHFPALSPSGGHEGHGAFPLQVEPFCPHADIIKYLLTSYQVLVKMAADTHKSAIILYNMCVYITSKCVIDRKHHDEPWYCVGLFPTNNHPDTFAIFMLIMKHLENHPLPTVYCGFL